MLVQAPHFCGPPAVLEGPLIRCHTVCMDVCMNDVGFSSTFQQKKVNPHMNAMTNFRKTWNVGSGGHKYYPCGLSSLNTHI